MDTDVRAAIEQASRSSIALYRAGKSREAVSLVEETWAVSREALADDDPLRLIVLQNAAAISELAGKVEQAIALNQEIVALARSTGDRLHLGLASDRLFELHRQREEHAAAVAAGDASLALWREREEPLDETVLTFMTNLGAEHFALGHYDEAERLAQGVLEGQRAVHGEMSAEVADAIANVAMVRQRQGALASAESLLLRSLDMRRQLFPAGSPQILRGLQSLAELYSSQDDHRRAVPFYEEVMAELRRAPAADPLELARTANNLATLYYRLGEVARSQPLYEEALKLTRSVRGETHREVAACVGNLANVLRDLGDLAGAERLSLEALSIRRAVLDEQHPEIAVSIGDLRELYRRQRSAQGLERLYREAFDGVFDSYQRRGAVSPDFVDALRAIDRVHVEVAGADRDSSLAQQAAKRNRPGWLSAWQRKARGRKLVYLAELLLSLKELDLALPLLTEAREVAAGDPPAWWRAAAALLSVLARLGRQEEAVRTGEEILAEVSQGREASDEGLAAILRTKAAAEWELGRQAAAVESMRRSLALYQRAFGERDLRTADAMVRLAELEKSSAALATAEGLARQGVEIAQAADAPLVAARGRVILAEIAARRGEVGGAEALYQAALATFEAMVPGAWETAVVLRDLAWLYARWGRAQRALPLLERATEIATAAFGPRSVQALGNRIRMAETLQACGRLAEAVEMYRQIAGDAEAAGDAGLVSHAWFASGTLYLQIGANDGAQFALTKALELLPASPDAEREKAAVLVKLAVVAARKGHLDAALAVIDQAITLYESLAGASDGEKDASASSSLQMALEEKAWILARGERWQEAFDCFVRASALLEPSLLLTFVTASEREREDLAQTLYAALDVLLALAVRLGTAEAAAAACDRVLRWKGVALEWSALQAASLSREELAEMAILRDEQSRLRTEIATRLLAGGEDPGELRRRQEALDVELAKRVAAVAERRPQASAVTVAQALPHGVALVEYVRFEAVDFALGARANRLRPGRHRYAAFVLSPETADCPRMLDLADADEIDDEVRRLRSWITLEEDPFGAPRPAPFEREPETKPAVAPSPPPLSSFADFRAAGRALRRKLLDPVVAGLADGTRLCIAPHGDLNRLPFAALALDGEGYVLDRYELSFLNSGRELLRVPSAPAPASAPLVIADPDFDLGLENVAIAQRRAVFPRLDGTRAEGEAIAALLAVPPVLAAAAVEDRVRNAKSPRILHLATHGFFLQDDRPPVPGNVFDRIEVIEVPGDGRYVARAVDPVQAIDDGPPVDRYTRIGRLSNPLLRSGIALAGANTWVAEGALPPEAGDGLLTAEEICALDFRGTELAVLSACETGLGEVRGGEGIYGLRRAFTIAGARTLVMSLWKVPDEQTRDLMVEFYRRVCRGEPYSEALRAAQSLVRQSDPEPVCWAGFVCFGERSRLPGTENPLA